MTGDTAASPPPRSTERRWEVALSFAGTQRPYVEQVAAVLKARGVRVFYDADETGRLWGKDLAEELTAVYAEQAGAVVVFVSAAYATRDWTRVERRAALARAARERREYVLPARFDDTALPELAGLAEVDLRSRDPDTFAELVAAKLTELGVTPPPAPEVLWGAVPQRNLFFTGREQVLADLHAGLTGPAGDAGPVVAVSALAGMGGVGKTQLAAEYAWRHADAYRLVWWVTAETPTQAAAGLAALADALGLPPGEPAQRQARLWAVLAGRGDWLLVYDNAVDPALLATVLPPRVTGRVLVTSRARLPRLPTVEVAVFDRAESVALLHHHLPGLPVADADRVAAALADLPLAVDQAGAYLAETPLGVGAYLRLLAGQPELALAEATPDHAGLAATVAAARTRLAALHPGAAALLDQFAFLAPDPVPLATDGPAGAGLVVAGPSVAGQAAEWLRMLVRLALVRRTGTGVQLHRLVAALLRARLDPDERAAVLGRCLHLLAGATPGDPADPAAWPGWAALAPHVQAAIAHPAPVDPEPFRGLVADCAWYLCQSGQLRPARRLAAAALDRWAGHPGPDHPHTLRVATALTAALTRLADFQAAWELAEDTLPRCRRILGDDHPTTLLSAVALAVALAALGEYPAAREAAEDTLPRCRRTLGDDHPTTLLSAAVLASALAGLGEYPAARESAEDTLPRCRRTLGDDHPTTLLSAAVLASALAGLGEYPAARESAEDTLPRCRRALGDDNPITLFSAAVLAAALAGLGEYPAARESAEDTLSRCRRALVDDRPITLFSAAVLAAALAGLGEYPAAREVAEDTLPRCRRALVDDHPTTLSLAAVLAAALAGLGEYPGGAGGGRRHPAPLPADPRRRPPRHARHRGTPAEA